MSMSEENFESLRKLLALKRHEQPPPGYFDRLSSSISARLRAEPVEKISPGSRIASWFSWKPALTYAFALGVFVTAFCGIQLSFKNDAGNPALQTNPLQIAGPGLDDTTLKAANVTRIEDPRTNPNNEWPLMFDSRTAHVERATWQAGPK